MAKKSNWREYLFDRLWDMSDRIESLINIVPPNSEDTYWAVIHLAREVRYWARKIEDYEE